MKIPKWMKIAWHKFERFGLFMASIFNFIFLLPVYFVSLGVVSLVGKINGKEFLNTKKNAKEQESYWKEYNCKTEEKETYYRMF